MRHSVKHGQAAILTTVAVATGLLAAASNVVAAPLSLTSVEVREQFVRCGYELGNPAAPPNNRYVVIRDPGAAAIRGADNRILMIIVYSDSAAATAAHDNAHRDAERALGQPHPFSNDHGPQLLVGYGNSVWRGNVAMFQTSSATLASLYTYDVQTDESHIARPATMVLGFVTTPTEYGVDRDFLACVENLQGATASAPGEPQPMFIAGQPW
jgi:hypothetical protein